MNIVYITNTNPKFVQFVNNSIESIKLHNTNCNFYVIISGTDCIKELDHDGIKQIRYEYDDEMNLKELRNSVDRHALISYTKLFLHEILSDLDKCLFVDADTICFGNIEHLYNTEVEYIGCRYDNCDNIYEISKLKQSFYRDYDSNIDRHIMSTLMLMNLKNLRKIDFKKVIFKDYVQLYNDYKLRLSLLNKMSWHDFWHHEEMYLTVNFFKNIQYMFLDKSDFMQLHQMESRIEANRELSKFLKLFDVRNINDKSQLKKIKTSFIHFCGLSFIDASNLFLKLSENVSNARK